MGLKAQSQLARVGYETSSLQLPLAAVLLLQQPATRWCPAGAKHSSAHPELGPWGAASVLELFRKDSHPLPNETE